MTHQETGAGSPVPSDTGIISDPYESFVLFTNCSPKGRVALWSAEYQAEFLYLLREHVIHQLKDARLFHLTWNNNVSKLITSHRNISTTR
ncbi:hypothetical protein AAY473_015759, partial [Plecturocebus cupreus]